MVGAESSKSIDENEDSTNSSYSFFGCLFDNILMLFTVFTVTMLLTVLPGAASTSTNELFNVD
jgi:hypothetical protein